MNSTNDVELVPEPEAMLPVQAVRLVKKVPEVESRIQRGEILLTVAALVRARARAISEDLGEIRFTVTREEAELFARLTDRRAHINFERKYEALFVALARQEMKKLAGTNRERL